MAKESMKRRNISTRGTPGGFRDWWDGPDEASIAREQIEASRRSLNGRRMGRNFTFEHALSEFWGIALQATDGVVGVISSTGGVDNVNC